MKDQSKTKKQLISELAELRQRTAELEASETERKRAEEALRESEEKFRSLAEYSPNMIFINKRGRVVYANRKCEEMMGYTTGEFYSEDFDFLALIAPDQREAVKASFGKHVKGEDVRPYEYALVTKDGRRIEAILTSKLIDYEGERAILGTVIDITEHKQTEEALRDSYEKYRSVVDNANVGLVVIQDGQQVFSNSQVHEMLGYTEEEFNSMDFISLVHPEDRSYASDRIRQRLTGVAMAPDVTEMRVLSKSGDVKWIETNSTVIQWEGRPAVQAFVIDITDRKRAEEALRESEERYRSVVDDLPGLVCSFEPQGVITFVNNEYCNYFGKSRDELIGEDFLHLIPEEDRGTVMANISSLTPSSPVLAHEHQVIAPDGEMRWQRWTNRALFDKEGHTIAYQSFGQDITERKQAEEALRESEEKHRTLFETMTQGVVYQAADGQIISANPAAERILGLTLDQMQGRTSVDPRWKAIHEDGSDFPGDTHPAMVALKTGKEVRNVVMGVFNPRNEVYTWININAVPQFRPGEEEPYQVYTTLEDITERKRAEGALRESEERSRNIVESIPAGMHMYQLEPDGRLVFTGANPAADSILGVDNSQFVGKTIEQAFPALTETEVPEKYRLAASKGQAWHTDQIIYEENQIVGAFEVQAFQTSPGRMVAAFFDITERKQAEDALRQSEERYRQLFEAESDAIFLIENESGRILEANSAASVLYGYSRAEMLTKRNTDLSAEPEDTQQVTQETPVIMDQVVTIPLRLHRNKDGTVFPVEITGRFFTWQGRSVHIAAIRDITERKQAEEEREQLLAQIQEQAQRVQQIIDTVPEGVLLLDNSERIVLANPVSEEHLSTLADAKVGDTLTHLGNRPLAELLTSPPRGLWHEAATDGHSFQVIARPIEAGPTPSGWVLVIRDVTQQREIEQRIQQQERLASVGQLAAGIAHDFNNIMATIVLYAQMTSRMEGLPTGIRERMETIDQQAGHATHLIQQILDFSRRAVLDRHPLDLVLLLRGHVKLLGRTLPESIQVKLDYEPGKRAAPLIVNADPTRMQQMVTNLALNARDAMPEGGELRIGLERIEVRPGESPLLPEMAAGEWVLVTVSDTGTGIPPDVLPHIFEPFFTTRAPLGSGLGLAQVHGIVGQHGGRIDVDTQVGEGTTFTIYLPVHLAEPSTAASAGGLTALPTGRGETILIVEDDAVVRKALLDSLEGLNYTVMEAVNGQEALTVLERHSENVALLLSDVVMPGMGGIALLYALRERELTVPVVMLTGHPLEREMEDLQAQGIIDWLPKPPQLEDLAVVVARALAKD